MTGRGAVERIARAVLYEGYLLYPYRASSLKNAGRCTFGTLYPEAWGDRSQFQAECLVLGEESTRLTVTARFLHPAEGEYIERDVILEVMLPLHEPSRCTFSFDEVSGEVTLAARRIAEGAFQLTLRLRNTAALDSADRETALRRSLVSAHAALVVSGGRFVSMTDPPPDLAAAAGRCVNTGVWPVLAGEPGSADTLLASPIILSDYPQVAPESPGDLCDATEIDEILTLRILTLTDDEKAEVQAGGERGRRILQQAETLPAEHLMRLHGTIRGFGPARLESVRVDGGDVKPGDQVRLRPGKRADIFDSVLDGRVAVIAAIEQDLEDRVHVAVVLPDDPGRDLGEMRQIGHRFFFSPSELELLPASEARP